MLHYEIYCRGFILRVWGLASSIVFLFILSGCTPFSANQPEEPHTKGMASSSEAPPDLSQVTPPGSSPSPAPAPAPAPTPAPAPAPMPMAAYNCSTIQGPQTRTFYESNPTYTDPVDDTSTWKITTPAEQGMNAAMLTAGAQSLNGLAYINSFLVVRNGALVFERYYNGSARNHANNIHSASKSIWGAAVGIAIERGLIPSLDTRISDILPARYVNIMDNNKRAITVRHLVTMTSGIRWTEDSTEYNIESQADRVAAILSLPQASAPGTRFNYSTGDAHLVAAVLSEATKMSGCEFIHKNLLAPMGVVAERWGRDPQGYFTGGYNFYITPREMAKFGMLYVNKGNWNGQQLVNANWVQSSMQNMTSGYGIDFWITRINNRNAAQAWGWGGQMIYIVPDLNLVVVFTTNTRNFSQDTFNGESVVRNYVIPSIQ